MKAELSLPLDVCRLAREGLLVPGSSFEWHWTNYGQHIGEIKVSVEGAPDRVILSYQRTPYDGESQDVQCRITLTNTPCHYGGARVWFLCPRCAHRCARVYHSARDGRYACRRCLKLAYSSESESLIGRAWRRQHKIEAKLAANCEKPKGMHWHTYERLCDRLEAIQAKKDMLFLSHLARLGFRLK